MKNLLSPSLDGIRFAVQQVTNSVSFSAQLPQRRSPYRQPTFEVFEQRTVLSAAGLIPLPSEDALGEYAELAPPALQREVLQEAFTINSITLRINGKTDVTVGPGASPLALHAGDTLEVVGVDYFVSQLGDGLTGVIAAEGYLHKLDDTHGPGAVDYTDGRFGDPLNADPIVAGAAWQGGLDGSWTVAEGWDRLSLSLIRYFGDQSATAATFSLQLQVETPDFSISKQSFKRLEHQTFRVGETAYMTIEWGNAGNGRYHNYLEMDVHHVDDLESAVWVGVSVATLGKNESVSLVLENDNANDPFTQYWTPQAAGLHRLLIAVDPEDAWQEKRESNNRVELWVTVEEASSQPGGPQTKIPRDAWRVAHRSLEGLVPAAGTAAGATATSPGSVPLIPPLAADSAVLTGHSRVAQNAVANTFASQLTPGRELLRAVAPAVTRATDDMTVPTDVGRDRWRWTGLDVAQEDELTQVDALLAGDDLLDSLHPAL